MLLRPQPESLVAVWRSAEGASCLNVRAPTSPHIPLPSHVPYLRHVPALPRQRGCQCLGTRMDVDAMFSSLVSIIYVGLSSHPCRYRHAEKPTAAKPGLRRQHHSKKKVCFAKTLDKFKSLSSELQKPTFGKCYGELHSLCAAVM